MAKLKIDGRELRAVNLATGRARDVVSLQTQSGMRLKEIGELGESNDMFAMLVTSFLSQHNAGLFVKWDDLMDGPVEALGQYVREPGDATEEAEAEAEENPTLADSATSAAEPENPSPEASA